MWSSIIWGATNKRKSLKRGANTVTCYHCNRSLVALSPSENLSFNLFELPVFSYL